MNVLYVYYGLRLRRRDLLKQTWQTIVGGDSGILVVVGVIRGARGDGRGDSRS